MLGTPPGAGVLLSELQAADVETGKLIKIFPIERMAHQSICPIRNGHD
jgi:hypothetical protein